MVDVEFLLELLIAGVDAILSQGLKQLLRHGQSPLVLKRNNLFILEHQVPS